MCILILPVFGCRAHHVRQYDRSEIAESDAAVDVPRAQLYHSPEQCTTGGSGADFRSNSIGVERENEETGNGQVGVVLPEGGDIV